ncbi:histidine kinase [Ochrobactrum sp. MYb15]|uniref:sensor histidine kinase n=1 Tax=Brucella TaxID=234 RepID=UPI000465D475|nr:CHASE3 domain-containing protein [Brucella rhizosphaerae]PQZ47467.1 histidine kinase [Ochrobactrum sp. MYb19]PRA53397.1 histidine kinase [Ochrobactrum sp. MYb68]PRA62155.1 histidine kinase [Ochrobactrum sp. MYb18]PRA77440.1 histidine kinase [Brucella thiophenivorans]PRA87519.1 histidine kinase [Ochrobactrum sp. MYb14]PRA99450.1 histidine kinase [Ochrobactrum sp. MYb15]
MASAFSNRLLKPSVRPIAFIVSLSLVLLSALITLFLSYGVNSQVVDISKNFELREQVSRVTRIAYNIEMSRRGYLLTLDDAYLELYQHSIVNIDQTLSDLALLTEGNPQQDVRVKKIRALVERAHDDVRTTVNLAKAGKVQEAIEKVRGDEGRLLMDQLSDTVSQFIATEEQELAERNAHIHQMRYWLTATSIVALASAVMLSFLLFSRVQRAARVLFEGQSALLSEKELLEQRVSERTAELEKERGIAERERQRVEILLQDSNHRIGNSLATVSSLLGLQLRQTRSEEARSALSAARDRVQTVSTAHRRLRLGEDMESTRIDEFLETVIEDIRNAIGEDRKISFQTDFAPLDLKARDVTTVGIILGELITNAVKHAFKGRQEGQIAVSFRYDGETGIPALIVEDNGVGWQRGDAENAKEQTGLGTLVVEQLCMQFGEKPVYEISESGSGTRVIVRLSSLAKAKEDRESEVAG